MAFIQLIMLIILLCIPAQAAATELAEIKLFQSGAGGYHTYRIPALLTTGKGTILAFCEGRRHGSGDSDDIDLLLKRSEDRGQTWSKQKLIWDDGPNTCGNPCPVQNLENGRIFLFSTWNLGTDREAAIIGQKSKDTRRIFVMISDDDGRTWSEAQQITNSVKRKDWTWYATGPGSALQLMEGRHRGRIVVPCDHIEAETGHYYSHVFYSDDHGKTWKLGGSTPSHRVNECMVVELLNGDLILNMRNYDRTRKFRAVSKSRDGGETWSEPVRQEALIEPICQAGFINYAQGDLSKGNWLVFTNPASSKTRINMTIRLSTDGGKTWPFSRVLHSGPSAYSDLAVLSNGAIVCLYEGGDKHPYQEIRFVIMHLEDLDDFGEVK